VGIATAFCTANPGCPAEELVKPLSVRASLRASSRKPVEAMGIIDSLKNTREVSNEL